MSRLSEDDIAKFRREQKALAKKKSTTGTPPITPTEAENSGTESNPPLKRRKRKGDEENVDQHQQSIDQFMKKPPRGAKKFQASGSTPPNTWKNTLTEFEDCTSEEITSLWDSRVNLNALVESNLVFDLDKGRIKKIGLPEACQAMMTKSLEVAAIAKMVELELCDPSNAPSGKALEEKEKEINKLKSSIKLMEKNNKSQAQKISFLNAEVENMKNATAALEQSAKDASKAYETLQSDAEKLKKENAQLNKLKEEYALLEETNTQLKMSVLEQLEAGFEKAKDQIKFVNPDTPINMEGIGPYMRVVDGKLVDPDEEEEGDQEGEGESN